MPSATKSAQRILRISFFRSAASSVEWPMINSAVVMNSEPKLLHSRKRDNPPTLPLNLNLRHSRVMKQILLGVTAMVAEVSLCERSQPRGVQSSRPGKILFPQHPLDPDVDRKGAQALVSKEHHAISNLRAHARELA